MKKIHLIGLIGIVFLGIVFVLFRGNLIEENNIQYENIDPDTKILTIEEQINGRDFTRQDIEYEKDNQTFRNYFDPNLRDSLDWIKSYTNEDSIFLCWWDYGHMIRGYTDRDVIIYSPSEDILWTISSQKWDTEGSGEFSSREKIDDVVKALTTTDSSETKEIMEKYDSEYIFVTESDEGKSYVLFKLAGYDDSEYLIDYEPTEKALETVLFKTINGEEIDGFNLVYSDDYVKIYQLNEFIL